MSGYEPFASFDQWVHLIVDGGRWNLVLDHVAELRSHPTDLSWLDGPLRAAAYQSGAIEGLHPGDRGLTMTLIDNTPGWNWEQAVRNSQDTEGVDVVAYIEAGVEALQMALDVATNHRPLSESWIRQVHQVVCGPQQTYRVHTPAGPQDHPLIKGSYKQHDNHVVQPDGSTHWYAPASEVAPEMERFAAQLSSDEFAAAHPVMQAAFVHHSFTHVHPFADGNGRVARVITSVYLLRAISLPLFLFADRRDRYFAALSDADNGRLARFAEEVLRAVEDLAALLVERSRANRAVPGGELKMEEWRSRVDAATAFRNAVSRAVARATTRHDLTPRGAFELERMAALGSSGRLNEDTHPISRSLFSRTGVDVVRVTTDLSSTGARPFSLVSQSGGRVFSARPDDVWPDTSVAFELRLDAWLDQVVADVFAQLSR